MYVTEQSGRVNSPLLYLVFSPPGSSFLHAPPLVSLISVSALLPPDAPYSSHLMAANADADAEHLNECQVPPPRISSDADRVTTESVKISTHHGNQKSSTIVSSTGASLSTNPDQASDVASIHSMPAVLVTESPRPTVRRPSTAASPTSTPRPEGRPEPTLTQNFAPSGTVSSTFSRRRARYRSAIEVCTVSKPSFTKAIRMCLICVSSRRLGLLIDSLAFSIISSAERLHLLARSSMRTKIRRNQPLVKHPVQLHLCWPQ